MAKKPRQRGSADPGGPPSAEEWRALIPTGVLVGSVLLAFVLAAAWQLHEPKPTTTARAPETHRPGAAEARPSEPTRSAPEDDEVARRAANDRDRLASSTAAWTLQFSVACDPHNVRVQSRSLTDEADFYLLTKNHDNRECFRFCWGAFDSRDQAAAQQRFPAALAAMTARPLPLPLEQALQ